MNQFEFEALTHFYEVSPPKFTRQRQMTGVAAETENGGPKTKKPPIQCVYEAAIRPSASHSWQRQAAPRFATNGSSPEAEGHHEFGVTGFAFDLAASGSLSGLEVAIILPNTWQGDYKGEFIHAGFTTTLIDRPGHLQTGFGFSADNYGNLAAGSEFMLSDVGALHCDLPTVPIPGIANVTGKWLPDSSLSAFDGVERNGIWTLRITDSGAGDTGVLRQFSLTMVPEPSTLAFVAGGVALLTLRRQRRRFR